MSKYLMITGSFPPQICGVGDYVGQFMQAADKSKWELFHSSNWRISTLFAKIKHINHSKCETIVMQYPTQGYGWSIVPHLICFYFSLFSKKKFVVVLHEFSQLSFKARWASSILLLANKIIFTNEFEKQYGHRHFLVPLKKCFVIKIISNIPVASEIKTWRQRHIDIAYFGHFRPRKGLEDFFEITSDIYNRRHNINICIIGQLLPEYKTYFDFLCHKYPNIRFEKHLNLSNCEVAEILNDTKIVFLPFPDGLSERRGSFLASISNGAIVVSYEGIFTTKQLKKIALFTTLAEAPQYILNILDSTTDKSYERIQLEYDNYLKNNIPKSWNSIVELYESIIA